MLRLADVSRVIVSFLVAVLFSTSTHAQTCDSLYNDMMTCVTKSCPTTCADRISDPFVLAGSSIAAIRFEFCFYFNSLSQCCCSTTEEESNNESFCQEELKASMSCHAGITMFIKNDTLCDLGCNSDKAPHFLPAPPPSLRRTSASPVLVWSIPSVRPSRAEEMQQQPSSSIPAPTIELTVSPIPERNVTPETKEPMASLTKPPQAATMEPTEEEEKESTEAPSVAVDEESTGRPTVAQTAAVNVESTGIPTVVQTTSVNEESTETPTLAQTTDVTEEATAVPTVQKDEQFSSAFPTGAGSQRNNTSTATPNEKPTDDDDEGVVNSSPAPTVVPVPPTSPSFDPVTTNVTAHCRTAHAAFRECTRQNPTSCRRGCVLKNLGTTAASQNDISLQERCILDQRHSCCCDSMCRELAIESYHCVVPELTKNLISTCSSPKDEQCPGLLEQTTTGQSPQEQTNPSVVTSSGELLLLSWVRLLVNILTIGIVCAV